MSEQAQDDNLGRVDTLLIEGLRRFVVNSGDPAYLAMYGKYGPAVNDWITEFLGPVKREAK
jgi:hypothetical protein